MELEAFRSHKTISYPHFHMFHSKISRVLGKVVYAQQFSRLVKTGKGEPLKLKHFQKPRMRVGNGHQWQHLQSEVESLRSDLAREKEENLAVKATKCTNYCNLQSDLDREKREDHETGKDECAHCRDLQSKIEDLQAELDFEKTELRETKKDISFIWFLFIWWAIYESTKP